MASSGDLARKLSAPFDMGAVPVADYLKDYAERFNVNFDNLKGRMSGRKDFISFKKANYKHMSGKEKVNLIAAVGINAFNAVLVANERYEKNVNKEKRVLEKKECLDIFIDLIDIYERRQRKDAIAEAEIDISVDQESEEEWMTPRNGKRSRLSDTQVALSSSPLKQELERERTRNKALEEQLNKARKEIAELKAAKLEDAEIYQKMHGEWMLKEAELTGKVQVLKELSVEAIVEKVVQEKVKIQVESNNDLVQVIKSAMKQNSDLSQKDVIMDGSFESSDGPPGLPSFANVVMSKTRRISRPDNKESAKVYVNKRTQQRDYIVVAEIPLDKLAAQNSLYESVKKCIRLNADIHKEKITIVRIKEVSSIVKGKTILRVHIFVSKESEIEALINILNKDPTKNFDVRKFYLQRPLVKIIGVDNDRSPDEVAKEILMYNPIGDISAGDPTKEETEKAIKFAYKLKNKTRQGKNQVDDFIYECDPRIHSELVKRRKIKISCQVVIAANKLRFVQCYRCLGFNHTAQKCPMVKLNKFRCSKCTGNHKSIDCTVKEEEITCANCVDVNKGIRNEGAKIKTNHDAFHKDCPTRVRAMERAAKMTDSVYI